MEYRQRQRRRASRRKGNGGTSSNTAKVVIVLIVAAVLVYMISASAIGTWIAKNVFAPMFETADGWLKNITSPGASTTPDTEQTDDPNSISLPSEASGGALSVTDEVQFPALECFALQMGVFSEKSNAEAHANELKSRGAGGYIMEDGGRYRVFAAAYSSKDSLTSVRERLEAEGYESAAYTFSSSASTLRITAPQEKLDEISAAFTALSQLNTDMAEAALEFDKQEQSPEEGRERAYALLERLRDESGRFLAIDSGGNAILEAVGACFNTCESALAELSGYQTQSAVDFASKMKYTHISIVHAYEQLSKAILSAA